MEKLNIGNKKKPSTSKLILLAVFALCIEIVIFSEFAMIYLRDSSAMYALIGIPVSLVPVVLGYYYKSKVENSVGGIVHDIAMKEFEQGIGSETPSEEE